jgi:hypothetical protein
MIRWGSLPHTVSLDSFVTDPPCPILFEVVKEKSTKAGHQQAATSITLINYFYCLCRDNNCVTSLLIIGSNEPDQWSLCFAVILDGNYCRDRATSLACWYGGAANAAWTLHILRRWKNWILCYNLARSKHSRIKTGAITENQTRKKVLQNSVQLTNLLDQIGLSSIKQWHNLSAWLSIQDVTPSAPSRSASMTRPLTS